MVEIVNSLNIGAWRDFVAQQPEGNIFHTPEMFQVFARAKGYQPELWAAVDSNGLPLALLPTTTVTLVGGPFRLLTSRALAYGSIVCQRSPEGASALAALLTEYRQRVKGKVLFTELRNLSDLSHLQNTIQDCGYAYEDHVNYLIELGCQPEQVLANIGARTRKHIRHGLNKGSVVVEQMNERAKLTTWYEVVAKTYRTARVPLADRSLFEAAYDVLHPKGMIQFWLARVGEDTVAASAELLYKDLIYGWYGGVDRDYAHEQPGIMLMWHILSWGAENGFRTYDFGGAGRLTEQYGVRDFKAKFGGALVCYGRNTLINSPRLFRLSKLGYQIVTRRGHIEKRIIKSEQ